MLLLQELVSCVVRSCKREVQVGDLVHHYIFPRHEWTAIILEIRKEQETYDDMARVRMLPGVKYEHYFTQLKRSENGYGWIRKKWLWVYNGGRTDIEIIDSFFNKNY